MAGMLITLLYERRKVKEGGSIKAGVSRTLSLLLEPIESIG